MHLSFELFANLIAKNKNFKFSVPSAYCVNLIGAMSLPLGAVVMVSQAITQLKSWHTEHFQFGKRSESQ